MTFHDRGPRVVVACIVCLFSAVGPAAADYHDTFVNAIRMFRGERWKEAASLFRSARTQRPRETGRIQISGNDTEPYLPSYFLGESLYRLGDCTAAMQAWAQADLSRMSLSQRMLSHVSRARALCRQQGRPSAPVATAATPQPSTSERPGVRRPSAPAGDSARFRVGADIQGPQRIKYVAPVYPAAARRAGITGSVVVEATIDPDGRVAEARAIRSVPQLDQAAIDAVGQWEFEPTIVNGVAVTVVMTTTIFFSGR